MHYLGEQIVDYINKKRVIYIQDFKDDEELLTYINSVDNNESLYESIINEPIYIKTPGEIFTQFKKNILNVMINFIWHLNFIYKSLYYFYPDHVFYKFDICT